MPIYEYQCLECGHKFEWLSPRREDAEKVNCPQCQSKRINRLFSVFGYKSGSSFKSSSLSPNCTGCFSRTCNTCK